MRIVVNACSAFMGGALTYLTNLVEVVPQISRQHQILIVAPPKTQEKLQTQADDEVFTWHPIPELQEDPIQQLSINLDLVPSLAKQHKADVLFSSTGFGSLRAPCPELLLVRNPVFFCRIFQQRLHELGQMSWSFRFKRWMGQLSMMCADHVLFPSAAMMELALDGLPAPHKPMHVLHYGFSKERFFQMQGIIEPHPIVEKMKRWKEDGYHVFLHVSSYAIHKNMETLIEALGQPALKSQKIKLVTTLSREKTGDRALYDLLEKRIQELGLQDTVQTTQHLPYDQTWSVYQAADAFLFPSFAESFGHPIVEAMSSNLPVIAANMPIHRELCQDAALYFDVFSPEDCARKILQFMQEPSLAKKLAQHAQHRAQDFSWKSYFQDLLSLLQECAASKA